VSPAELKRRASQRLWATVEEAAEVLDMKRSTAYASIHAGTFPVRVIQVSPHQWRISFQALLELAGLAGEVRELRAVP
jgi:Helix-turn-helix domain